MHVGLVAADFIAFGVEQSIQVGLLISKDCLAFDHGRSFIVELALELEVIPVFRVAQLHKAVAAGSRGRNALAFDDASFAVLLGVSSFSVQ